MITLGNRWSHNATVSQTSTPWWFTSTRLSAANLNLIPSFLPSHSLTLEFFCGSHFTLSSHGAFNGAPLKTLISLHRPRHFHAYKRKDPLQSQLRPTLFHRRGRATDGGRPVINMDSGIKPRQVAQHSPLVSCCTFFEKLRAREELAPRTSALNSVMGEFVFVPVGRRRGRSRRSPLFCLRSGGPVPRYALPDMLRSSGSLVIKNLIPPPDPSCKKVLGDQMPDPRCRGRHATTSVVTFATLLLRAALPDPSSLSFSHGRPD